jgi:hypothetical protein
VFVTFFITTLSEITYRYVELSRRIHRTMIGWYTIRVGHRVKNHKITPVMGKERGDLEIKDYVVLQKLPLLVPSLVFTPRRSV